MVYDWILVHEMYHHVTNMVVFASIEKYYHKEVLANYYKLIIEAFYALLNYVISIVMEANVRFV